MDTQESNGINNNSSISSPQLEKNSAKSLKPQISNGSLSELTPEQKLGKLFENIFQVTLDTNYMHATNKYIFIGETEVSLEPTDLMLKPENLDEVYTCFYYLIINFFLFLINKIKNTF